MDKTICLIDVEDSVYYSVGVSEDREESRAEFRAGSHKLLATKPLSHQEGENAIGKLKSCNVGYDAAQKWWKIHEDDVAVLAEIFPEAAFSTFVYLIIMGTTVFYKVGRSKNPEGRLRDLQTGNPYPLSFVRKKQTSDSEGEGKVKDALKNYKANMGGGSEWFKLDTPSKVDEAKNAIDGLKPAN